jgi:hypothetical protein
MNNSGENETFKFSGYTSPYKRAAGTNNSNNIYDTIVMNGTNNSIIGGVSNQIPSSGGNNFIGGGNTNTIPGGSNNFIAASENGTINNASYFVMLGCYNSTASMGNDNSNTMIGGYSNLFNANGVQGNAMIGGRSNSWYHFDSRDPVIGAPRYGLGSMIGGYQNIIAGLAGTASGSHAYPFLVGGKGNSLRGQESTNSATSGCSMINSYDSTIIGPTNASGMFECLSSTISGKTQAVMIGCSGRTATTSQATFVENLVVFNYSNLNYADDTAAAAGGVVLGQVYHNAGALRIRIV